MLSLRLRELRNEKGVPQIEIANLLKITREAYSMYESGKRQMNHESLCILAEYYNVSVDYLLCHKACDNVLKLSDEETDIINKYDI